MIQKYVHFLAIISCFSLLATDTPKRSLGDTTVDDLSPMNIRNSKASLAPESGSVTEPISAKILDKVLYRQYPAFPTKRPGASGYEAVKNSYIVAESERQFGTKFAEIVVTLRDDLSSLYEKEDSVWPAMITATRGKKLVQKYLKDVILYSIKGAKQLTIPSEYMGLLLDGKIPLFDADREPDSETLNALVGLLSSVVEKLTPQITEKSATEHVYTVSKDAILQGLKNEAKQNAKNDPACANLAEDKALEKYMPDLASVEFTLKSGKNEYSINTTDPQTGAPKEYKKTYNADKITAGLSDLLKKPEDKKPVEEKKSDASETAQDLNGDWLDSADVSHILNALKEKHEELAEIPVSPLISSQKESQSIYKDILLDFECERIVSKLEENPKASFAVAPILCENGHWIACLVSKKYGELHLVVVDSDNKDRRNEPVVLTLASAVKNSLKKHEEQKKAKPETNELKSEASKAEGQKEDELSYAAPLDKFDVRDLPPLAQFFSGKTPNELLAPIARLQKVLDNDPKIGRLSGAKQKNALLLYGPPGTGKSTIAQLIARIPEKDGKRWNRVFKNAGAFRTAFQGSSEELLNKFINKALSMQPCVIIFDEIDAIGQKLEPHNSTQEDNRAIKVLLSKLDELLHNKNIYVIATTNYPEKLDPAVIRRFVGIEVPLPTYEGRKQIIKFWLDRQEIEINDNKEDAVSENFLEALTCATKKFSGDGLEALIGRAIENNDLGLAAEKNVGMGFWFRGIDTSKSLYRNISSMLENPFVPAFYWLNAYATTKFDKHLYNQYLVERKKMNDIEDKEHANDSHNKLLKLPFKEKVKAAFMSAITSAWDGIWRAGGGDIYGAYVRPPIVKGWNKITSYY